MGNILGRPNYRGIVIDGGQAQIKDKPRNPLSAAAQSGVSADTRRVDPNEYDPVLVGRLIVGKRLAPFYEGKFDQKGETGSVARSQANDRVSVHTTESTRRRQQNHPNEKKKKKKGKSSETVVNTEWLNSQLIECPICLLWYPRNINYTKCCKKPICTLCFVSMKRPTNQTKLVCCPFCRGSNFTVMYRSPEKILARGRFKTGVECERIRPARIIVAPTPRPVYYRYTAVGGQGGQPVAFAYPRAPGARASGQQFTYYQPRTTAQTRGRTITVLPTATAGQRAAAGLGSTGPMAQRRQFTQQEVQAYEERSLQRAIRLSMQEY